MKTIRECLKECNRTEIINTYMYKYAFNYRLMDDEMNDVTIGEIKEKFRERLNGLMDRLIETEPIKEDETWILMVVHTVEEEFSGDIRTILVKKSDVLNRDLEIITPYGYEFSPFEEVAGFYVADTYLTQYNLVNLIVDYLFEVSFTGYNHETLEETLNELEESVKELESGEAETVPFEEVLKKWEEEGFVFEKKDPRQEEAWRKYIRQSGEYAALCFDIEIEKLRELLKE